MVGAGNVATHLATRLQDSGHGISSIYSRNSASAEKLAAKLGVRGTSNADEVPETADFFVVAVPDDAVSGIIDQMRMRNGICLHTAGALPIEVLKETGPDFGVLYPLQTLSKNRDLVLEDSPFLIEGSSPEVCQKIRNLALSFSDAVYEMDSRSRLLIHLAAVFANNFTNHMVHIAHQILEEQNLDPQMILPLLRETVNKIIEMGPEEAQTGPALRNDRETMQKHLALLKESPEWEKIYTFISRDINRSGKE